MGKPGQPKKFKTATEITEKGEAYFAKCTAENRPFTVTGLAIALGTNRQGLCVYESGDYDKEEDDQMFSYAVKALKVRCEQYAEERLFSSSPTGAIFALKNYGWKDKVEQEHSGSVTTSITYVNPNQADDQAGSGDQVIPE